MEGKTHHHKDNNSPRFLSMTCFQWKWSRPRWEGAKLRSTPPPQETPSPTPRASAGRKTAAGKGRGREARAAPSLQRSWTSSLKKPSTLARRSLRPKQARDLEGVPFRLAPACALAHPPPTHSPRKQPSPPQAGSSRLALP